jgi:glycosyltransferase 2 family protein
MSLLNKKYIRLVLGFGISIFFIWHILNGIEIDDLAETLLIIDMYWIFIAFCFFLLGYTCRIWRWRFMLLTENPDLTWRQCSIPLMISVATNNVLPFRAGDILRAFGFSNFLEIKSTRILSTLIIEKILDLFILLLAFSAVFFFIGNKINGFKDFFPLATIIFVNIFFIIVFFILLKPDFMETRFKRVLGIFYRKFPKQVIFLSSKIENIFSILIKQTKKIRILKLIFWSLLVWVFEACVFYAVALALPDMSNPIAAWFAMPVGTLATLIPSSPGYVGTFHYFVIQAAEIFGNTATSAVAYAFLVHLMLWGPSVIWGGISFFFWLGQKPNLK